MGAVVKVRLLGKLELETEYGLIMENKVRKATSWRMLKYLLINRGLRVDKEELYDLLWPDRTGMTNIEGAMRTRLSRLRDDLKPLNLGEGRDGLVRYSDGKYWINSEYSVETDSDELDTLMRRIRGMEETDPEALALCYQALDLYRGDFMSEEDTGDWVLPYREHYQNVFLQLVETTIQRMVALQNDMPLTLLSQRMIMFIPYEKKLHTRLVQFMRENSFGIELVRHVSQLRSRGIYLDFTSDEQTGEDSCDDL